MGPHPANTKLHETVYPHPERRYYPLTFNQWMTTPNVDCSTTL